MEPLTEGWVAGWLLTYARVLPVCALSVALSRTILPWPVGLSVAIALTSAFASAIPDLPLRSLAMVSALATELSLGLAFALCTILPVLTLGWAARMAQRAVAGVERPDAPLGQLYAWVALLTFLTLSGHRALVMALSRSFLDLPPGALSLEREALAFGVAGFVMDAFGFAVALAMPLVVSVWLAGALVALSARALGVGQALAGSLRGPLWVLTAALLLAPLSARTPDAMREGLSAARAHLLRMVR